MDPVSAKAAVVNGKTALGIELGSTRIKAVLIGEDFAPLASGAHDWENTLLDGVWTYSLDEIHTGMQACFAALARDVTEKYGVPLQKVGAVGVSAMMHGYLAFDQAGKLLVPFRTWRNTFTEPAASELSALFRFNIPQRWSVAHLYHALLEKEPHIASLDHINTLAGYVHECLTGERVVGVGEASGMFPIDSETGDYDRSMLEKFDERARGMGLSKPLRALLPQVLSAGEAAGRLTESGARWLDPSGALQAGALCCPPEGDAGTGMVATNSVSVGTGNVSAGTSIFAMAVLPRALSRAYTEIDMVTTPAGKPVAMVHCNTCTSDLDAWVRLFGEVLSTAGMDLPKSKLYDMLYQSALQADADCGGLVNFNYFAGEPVTGLDSGCPMFLRCAGDRLKLGNFMRAQIYSALATLRIGMDILFDKENLTLTRLCGHGGLFKTPEVGQKLLAGALHTPVTVLSTAGEGGAWGAALLAAFAMQKQAGETLVEFLQNRVFGGNAGSTLQPDARDEAGFNRFLQQYKAALPVEKAAAAWAQGE